MKQNSKLTWIYLLYSFAIAWSCWLIIIISNRYLDVAYNGSWLYWILTVVAGLGPFVGSYIVFQKVDSESKFKSFWNYIFKIGMTKKAFLIFTAFSIWRVVMIWLAFGIDRPIQILGVILNLPFLIVLGGLEELGWRGFLQPRLEKVTNYWWSILIVAILWGLWHIPLWFIPGSVQSGIPFVAYLFSGIVLTASFTTFYKYTKNIFLTILSHAWFNGFIGVALYTTQDGTRQIDISYKAILLFAVEFTVSIVLAIRFNRRVKKNLVV